MAAPQRFSLKLTIRTVHSSPHDDITTQHSTVTMSGVSLPSPSRSALFVTIAAAFSQVARQTIPKEMSFVGSFHGRSSKS